MSSLFCLILFLSLHACNSRPLGLSDKQMTDKQVLLSGKDIKSSAAKEIRTQEKFLVKLYESIIYQRRESNTVPLQRNSKALEIKEEDNKRIKVNEQASQETREMWKRQARSTLQSLPHDAEETVDFKENDIPEDVVVMDYAQPQRKPPIHNKEP